MKIKKATPNRVKPIPCPLCGGKKIVYESYDGDKWIGCRPCSLMMNYGRLTKKAAAIRWNTRVNAT